MDYLYVLKLEKGKWYIGKSANVERRYEQHLTGKGAKWTQLHKPVQLVLKRPLRSSRDEDITTQQYIDMYGANNVRGGSYCQVEPITYYESEEEDDACFRCGRNSHWQADCYAKYHIDGSRL